MSGGGDTTNVTNTGLGDTQFLALQDGQQQIGDGLMTVNSNTQQGFAQTNANMNTGFSNVNNNINKVGSTLGNQINQSSQNLGNQINQTGTNLTNQLNQTGSNISNQVNQLGTNLGGSLNSGFAQTNNALNTIGSDVRSGVSDLRAGLTDTNANINNQFDRTNQINVAGFNGLGNMVDTGFTNQSDYLKAMQANVMGGQNAIRDLVNNTGQRLDTYYGDLAQGQGEIQGQVGNLQTGFSAFNNQYTRDAAQSRQNDADLQTGLMSSTSRIQDQIGRTSSAAEQNAARIMSAVGGVAANTAGGTGGATQSAPAIPVDSNATSQQNRQVFATKVNEVRTLLTQFGSQIDPAMRQTYTDIATSFDPNGMLIQNSPDAAGNTLMRSLDGANNLNISAFAPDGSMIGSRGYNVDEALSLVDVLKSQYTQLPSGGFVEPQQAMG